MFILANANAMMDLVAWKKKRILKHSFVPKYVNPSKIAAILARKAVIILNLVLKFAAMIWLSSRVRAKELAKKFLVITEI